jgi:hypothetical protein
MSVHRSLKTKNALERHRNVLSRAERLKILKDQERWDETKSVFGLPKVAHRKAAVGAKTKKAAAEAAGTAASPEAAAGATTPAPEAAKGAAKAPAKKEAGKK